MSQKGFAASFEHFSTAVTKATGSSSAFLLAFLTIIVWLVTGPVFHYSDTWQLIINTSTTIVTFLMVFLIQKSQNKDSMAIQLKLNELIAAQDGASNRFLNVEDLSEEELLTLHRYFAVLVEKAKKDTKITASHSVEEAEERHEEKLETQQQGKPQKKVAKSSK
ncbi:low affinity Fe/Cu permease [Larkinella arboricola]|uniref:Low affinity Fe/Cu permease n=1 Tax=Larkinella arboricola TaxID=643671 RepID=A0A327WU27_LARAB|nr:low affinity iron permease family protein [Larkinella arboricola]RAJ95920.1 low affinity Fe/Cu permease [Larkinella arboricola]